MAHAIPHPERQLDGNRIVGTAGAIAVNVALLMLLMVPMSVPQETIEETITTVIPIFDKPKPVDPPPPPPPVKIEQIRPRTSTPQPIPIEIPPTPPIVDPIATDSIVVPDTPPQPETFARADLGRGEMIAGMSLQVINNPAPTYPGEAVRNQLTGTVMLEILVGIDGKPIEVTVVKSSGHRVLDQAAKRVVMQRWTFEPAMQAGQAVQARGRVPIEFTLER
ncbi:energy transducer TonB [Lysobacter sp. 5GHs7-4]|uniref:energy transducer TonB n=1 Tax=Lysobacter sp. 5GHs7-4 TaxID=2904253 RepID=UPI001E4FEBAE|nr:energy transducer TonB [Lysobacter sp. 5GHs7-4]UHQ22032.1 energy transducer TonB [Lysobacter sp. 5GHs7-4]